jgi:hypothetical protein
MSFRVSRCLWSAPLLAAGVMSPASAHVTAAPVHVGRAASPSKLDYLVLSSLADSPSIWAMSSYSPTVPHDPLQ